MSFLAILAPAWVPSEFNYRWSLPSDPLSDEGLGGGITWALDQSFCDTMLPSFHEDAPTTRYYRFVDCKEIKDAFIRAFATWSANHKQIRFHDVSTECERSGLGAACAMYGQPWSVLCECAAGVCCLTPRATIKRVYIASDAFRNFISEVRPSGWQSYD